jgi:hypothetical protein
MSSMSTVTPVSSKYLSAMAWKPPPWLASPDSQNLMVSAPPSSSPPPMNPQALRGRAAAPAVPALRTSLLFIELLFSGKGIHGWNSRLPNPCADHPGPGEPECRGAVPQVTRETLARNYQTFD